MSKSPHLSPPAADVVPIYLHTAPDSPDYQTGALSRHFLDVAFFFSAILKRLLGCRPAIVTELPLKTNSRARHLAVVFAGDSRPRVWRTVLSVAADRVMVIAEDHGPRTADRGQRTGSAGQVPLRTPLHITPLAERVVYRGGSGRAENGRWRASWDSSSLSLVGVSPGGGGGYPWTRQFTFIYSTKTWKLEIGPTT